jgi:hypothetical protein
MNFTAQHYAAAATQGLAKAIVDRMDFHPDEFQESVQTAINGVLSSATDEQQADIYARIIEDVEALPASRKTRDVVAVVEDALSKHRLFD